MLSELKSSQMLCLLLKPSFWSYLPFLRHKNEYILNSFLFSHKEEYTVLIKKY